MRRAPDKSLKATRDDGLGLATLAVGGVVDIARLWKTSNTNNPQQRQQDILLVLALARLARRAEASTHISAAIIVLAGAVLLLGGSFIPHADTKLFVQVVGCIVGTVGLAGWMLGSNQS